jgi:hypothetical protein
MAIVRQRPLLRHAGSPPGRGPVVASVRDRAHSTQRRDPNVAGTGAQREPAIAFSVFAATRAPRPFTSIQRTKTGGGRN